MKSRFFCILLSLMLFSLCITSTGCCDQSHVKNTGSLKDKTHIEKLKNEAKTVWETNTSANGKHVISSIVTRTGGICMLVDGAEIPAEDDLLLRFSPIIGNSGAYLWIEQRPGYGYDAILCGKSVLRSGAYLGFCAIGEKTAVFVESDIGNSLTRIYSVALESGELTCVAVLAEEYTEECEHLFEDKYGIITSSFSETGDKQYYLYLLDAAEKSFDRVAGAFEDLITFTGVNANDLGDDGICIRVLKMSDNDRYLYNALQIVRSESEAFAYGNDLRGRISWSESQRLRGLCELYKKTKDPELKERILDICSAILLAQNQYTGIHTDDWNPDYLWASKSYSIDNAPVSILVGNNEILSSLLYACNEGIISKGSDTYQTVLTTAENAYVYYNQWYQKGHYCLPYGYPTSTDGIVVPWNYQNSMAETALGLYIETGNQTYLKRSEELISAFKSEWVETDDRIYWHYWPNSFYDGWNEESGVKSMHLPSKEKTEDALYEDASHAGISVRLLCRYAERIPNGVITEEEIRKIENNMQYFCFPDGFSRFISGDTEYVPKAWHYWISPYFSYLHNEAYSKYVAQGYLKCFPTWDSQESLFSNAKLYDPTIGSEGITVEEICYDFLGNVITSKEFCISLT